MINLEINNEKFRIKNDWDEISLAEFVDIIAIQQDSYSNLIRLIKTITGLCIEGDKDNLEDYMLGFCADDFDALASNFSFINEEFKPKKVEKNKVFEIDGEKYVMIPDFNKLTVGEMISLEQLLTDKKLDVNKIEIAFAILFRKLDENGKPKLFNEDDFMFVLNELKHKVIMADIIEHINFFFSGGKTSIKKNSRAFSIQAEEKTKTNMLECQKKKLKSTKKKKNV